MTNKTNHRTGPNKTVAKQSVKYDSSRLSSVSQ